MTSQIPNIIFFDKDRKAMCDVLGCALTDIKTAQRQVVTIIDKLHPLSEKLLNDHREQTGPDSK